MLVADNRAYDYSKMPYSEKFPSEQSQKQTVVKQKKKVKPKTYILNLVFVFAVSILLISRYALIAELNFTSRTLKETYNEAVKDKTDLNVKLMKTVNLDNLEKIAIEKLGMQYPEINTQMVYVQVEAPTVAKKNSNKEFHNANELKENKYIAYAKNAADSLFKILQ